MSDDAATSTTAPAPAEARPNAALWAEVHTWLTENWDPDRSVDEWWKLVAAAGWTAPHFASDQGGRGLPRRVVRTVRSGFKSFGALRPPGGLGLLMAAPTILTHGTPEQIDRLVHPSQAQRVKLDNLRETAAKAADLLKTSCPSQTPATPPARLAAMTARLDAMIEAVRNVRAAADEFYGSLTDEQKAQFNTIGQARAQQ